MTDDAPKMLPAEELDRLSQRADALIGNYGASARVVTLRCARSLLDHIAALNARIAKLEAAGDAMAEPYVSNQGDKDEYYQCKNCRHGTARKASDVRHNKWCPVPAWRAVREAA